MSASSAAHGTPGTSPRWLSDDERSAWMALIGVVVRLPAQLDRQLQRDAGITHFEFSVLATLSNASERTLRMSELAELTEAQLPRLSQVASRMEKRGWLVRRPDPTDGRYTLAELTDDGFAVLERSAPGHVEMVRRTVFDALTQPQIRQLREIGTRITTATAQVKADEAGSPRR
ncbi:MarR family winged helix-turn-helix transcriptional regulator [Williamsia sp. CHRR-6]|uniref:MarR family winged helix-turn-helix transcriptional regulator n=1 Tax=Williamsia sp. CHRR-6 TaxID=2835871 RepID=UPI001BDB22BE|nr:MarR family transcriptional regulator [Williamsia sp. CHRR-6]MBT0566360.1 MarR family transcriptional regulator [Williamsia sp. CHRR-6]